MKQIKIIITNDLSEKSLKTFEQKVNLFCKNQEVRTIQFFGFGFTDAGDYHSGVSIVYESLDEGLR